VPRRLGTRATEVVYALADPQALLLRRARVHRASRRIKDMCVRASCQSACRRAEGPLQRGFVAGRTPCGWREMMALTFDAKGCTWMRRVSCP
jgi:hypothetical protein